MEHGELLQPPPATPTSSEPLNGYPLNTSSSSSRYMDWRDRERDRDRERERERERDRERDIERRYRDDDR